ncbi:uncharacterized protein Z519_00606 [Cladophialophora bantiana CBS 173.52]|uniref:F-box domain-containing protein n=1 Tax=Cladophialophora bantiana (strain ATCC 10958 / CBS 173.52 / CDC B-1940 / NIH 8579) TaxID=1442370 RepID=A0A0D2HZS1_CLAB1|nr:uncharacterized protein Z519_00606 [Cladophialophora bantiana CBS 173.52]KIW98943.1 hypothetical protein Z519_00606 [Cladophialophora bantiana CBS 173.52]
MADSLPATSNSLPPLSTEPDLTDATQPSGSASIHLSATWIPPSLQLVVLSSITLVATPSTLPSNSETDQQHSGTPGESTQKEQTEQPQQQVMRPRPSQPDPYDPFFMPDSILLDSPVSAQTESKFLQLPPELLTDILKKVKIPYFQVSLALTCKTMARIAAQKNVLSPWRGYRDKDGLYRLLERKNNFIPPHMRLCRACFKFLPSTAGEYWDKQMSAEEFDKPNVNWYDVLMWFYAESGFQYRCPWCCAFDYSGYASEGFYNKQRAKEVLEDHELMHPELNRRMDRP